MTKYFVACYGVRVAARSNTLPPTPLKKKKGKADGMVLGCGAIEEATI